MTPIGRLQDLLGIEALAPYPRRRQVLVHPRATTSRGSLRTHIATDTVDHWLSILEPADIWCAKVLDWPELLDSEGFKLLDMLQTVTREDDVSIGTTRCPVRVNGERPKGGRAAPLVGEHTARIRAEFAL